MNKNFDSTLASWKAQVRSNIVRKVAELRADGTVSVSYGCLWNIVHIPSHGGPTGGNAIWSAKQIFRELVADLNLDRSMNAAGRRVIPFVTNPETL